jgi:Yip1-like protein
MEATEHAEALERDWWLRTLLVLQSPRSVFAALRDDSDEAASARQEPITAVVFLAGVAAALAAARGVALLDDDTFGGVLVAVWVVAAGGVQGLFGYWIAGAAVFAGSSGVGDAGSYRSNRHVVGFSAVPLVLLLAVWLVRVATFGGDVFRDGGTDHGALSVVLDAVEIGLYLWAAGLVLLGIHVVRGLSWPRTVAAYGVAAVLFAVISVLLTLL